MNEQCIELTHDDNGFLTGQRWVRDENINKQTLKNTKSILKKLNALESGIGSSNTQRQSIIVSGKINVNSQSKKAAIVSGNNLQNSTESDHRKAETSTINASNRSSARDTMNNRAQMRQQYQQAQEQEKQHRKNMQVQEHQTELLEEIAKQDKKKGGGFLKLFGIAAAILKALTFLPVNLFKGLMGGKGVSGALRGADGKFIARGAAGAAGVAALSKFAFVGKLLKGGLKTGLLASLMTAIDGVRIENDDDLTRGQKNKAHVGNIAQAGGGIAGALAGAKLGAIVGSVVPVVGTTIGAVVGGILGGFGGVKLMEKWGDWLDSLIDPTISEQMFTSWQGFTTGIKTLWHNFTTKAGLDWRSVTQFAKSSWQDFTHFLHQAGKFVWYELIPDGVAAHFATLGALSKQAWDNFTTAISPYWESVKSAGIGAWTAFSNAVKPYWDNMTNAGEKVWNAIYEAGMGLFNTIANSSFGQAVSGWWNNAKNTASSWLDSSQNAYQAEYQKQEAGYQQGKDSVGNNVANQSNNTGNHVLNLAKDKIRAVTASLGFDFTKKYDYLKYNKGSRSLSSGEIDCSGWTFQISKVEMESMNKALGYEKYKIQGNRAGSFHVGLHGAAEQIGIAAAEHGVVTDSRTGFDKSKLKSGMMIGQMKHGASYKGRFTDVKGYGRTQYNHIVKVVQGRDGKLYISESHGGNNGGVTLTEMNKWVDMRNKRGDTLTAVNPYGKDIDLLQGELIPKTQVNTNTLVTPMNDKAGLLNYYGKAGFNGKAKNKIIRQTFANKERVELADRMIRQFNGGTIDGMNADDTAAYAAMVAATESGFNYKAVNRFGYSGAFQMGVAALEDIGLMKKGTSNRYKQSRAAMQNPSNWNIKGGLNTFLNSEAMQQKAFVDYTNKNIQYLRKKHGLKNSQIGIGNFGQLAFTTKAAHLKGHGGAKDLILKGIDSRDANGQSAREYGQQAKEASGLFRAVATNIRSNKVAQPVMIAGDNKAKNAPISSKHFPVINPPAAQNASVKTTFDVQAAQPIQVKPIARRQPPANGQNHFASPLDLSNNATVNQPIAHQPSRQVSHKFIAHATGGGTSG